MPEGHPVIASGLPSPRRRRVVQIPIARARELPGFDATLARHCPVCAAPPGVLCRNHVTGKPFAFHAYRWEYDWCMKVPCPFCSANPGELCHTQEGALFGFHRDRLNAGRFAKRQAARL